MATYVSLVNELLRRLNEVTLDTGGADFSSVRNVQALAKDAINSSVRLILQTGQEWPFLKTNGVYTHYPQAGIARTTNLLVDFPSDVGSVDWESFYLLKGTDFNPGPLPVLSFTEWQTKYRASDETGGYGKPQRIFQTQGDQFGVSPLVDNSTSSGIIFTINYVYWSYPADMSLYDDVCVVPDRFKHVVIDGAMMFMMRFRSNEQSAAMHQNNFEDGIKTMRRVLMDDPLSVRSTVIARSNTSSFTGGV
jgi:hypothetical protein